MHILTKTFFKHMHSSDIFHQSSAPSKSPTLQQKQLSVCRGVVVMESVLATNSLQRGTLGRGQKVGDSQGQQLNGSDVDVLSTNESVV